MDVTLFKIFNFITPPYLESIGQANVTNHEAEGTEETVVKIPDDDEHTDDVLSENIDPGSEHVAPCV